ncbi:MAG: hypothetical protein K0S78_1785 [Thermomicrobiales bacterium]|nr:hypothetical protein [Thermomicrobiales bacterium]
MGPLELQVNGAASGEGFVIVSSDAVPLPATLTLRTTDGSEGDVTLRPAAGSAATLSLSPETIHVSGEPATVQIRATSPSGAQNDTTIEVVQGDQVLAQYALTAVTSPRVRFRGRFQVRLASREDPYNHHWGTDASGFRMYAVQGPNVLDPAQPSDEPELDRIIRFQVAVARRPYCRPIGVAVTAIEADVGGSAISFAAGDPLIGEPVRLGPNCKIEEQDGSFAMEGRAPIGDFRLEVGSVFAGASEPATPDGQPVSNAPRAKGIVNLSLPNPPYVPADFGYPEATWIEHANAFVTAKQAQLEADEPTDPRAERIRARRLQEHQDSAASIAFPMRFMQNYTGEMDRELTFGPDPVGALAYLATLDEVQFSGDFLDFDTDCQSGAVTGTLGAKDGGPVFAAASLAAPGEGRYPPPGINDKNRVP